MLNRIQSNSLNQFKIYLHHKNISQKPPNILKRQYTCCGHIQINEQNLKTFNFQNRTHKNELQAFLCQKIGSQNVTQTFWSQKRSHQTVTEPFYHEKGNKSLTQLLSYQNRVPQNLAQPWSRKKGQEYALQPFFCYKKGHGDVTQPFWSQKRVHSTHSDQHRQKVVIETSEPNVIDKLRFEKIIPLEKEDRKLWDLIDPYVKLARWDKPIGVYLLYWPCTWSIALATIDTGVGLSTGLYTAGLFLIGAGLMRGAGCTINDMWDKDIDRQVERTSDRPLASGAISSRQALTFLAAQLSAALAVLLQLNCYSVALGASSMLLVLTYPLAKRFTNYPQIFLGATFNWGALLGFTAVSGALGLQTLPLYAGALAWTVVYDTIYAHQDKLDDARIGIKSCALSFGSHCKPLLATSLALSAGSLLAAGQVAGLAWPYSVAIAGYVAHVGRQIYTLDVDNPTDCADKFKSNSLVGLIILIGILTGGYEKYQMNRKKNEGKPLSENAKSCFFS